MSNELQPYQKLMVKEKQDIDLKIRKMQKFMKSKEYQRLPVDDRYKYRFQDLAMRDFSEFLQTQISNF